MYEHNNPIFDTGLSINKMTLKTAFSHRIELTAVFATGILKFIFMDWLMWRAFYIAGICILWIGYIFFSLSADRNILRHWGFKREHFKPVLVLLTPLVVVSIIFSFLYGHFNHSLSFTWQVIPILFMYPVWGVLQQYLMLGITSNSLMDILGTKTSRYLVIFIVSALFSLIHYPSLVLMAITFVMEVVFVIVYFRWKNLWAIGIAHGWVATFLLYYVLERNLWTELFGRFQI